MRYFEKLDYSFKFINCDKFNVTFGGSGGMNFKFINCDKFNVTLYYSINFHYPKFALML